MKKDKSLMVMKIVQGDLKSELTLPVFQINRLATNLAKEYRKVNHGEPIKFEFKKI